jgi:isopenicillin N synthase-like dioxygenase
MAAAAAISIPVIDIAAWAAPEQHDDPARVTAASGWDDAMTNSGFAMVRGHGVPAELIDGMRSAARSFFEEELETKMEYNHGPYGNKSGGFTAQGVESVGRAGTMSDGSSAKAPADLVENYVLRGRPEQWGASAGAPGLPEEGPLPAHPPKVSVITRALHCTNNARYEL